MKKYVKAMIPRCLEQLYYTVRLRLSQVFRAVSLDNLVCRGRPAGLRILRWSGTIYE